MLTGEGALLGHGRPYMAPEKAVKELGAVDSANELYTWRS